MARGMGIRWTGVSDLISNPILATSLLRSWSSHLLSLGLSLRTYKLGVIVLAWWILSAVEFRAVPCCRDWCVGLLQPASHLPPPQPVLSHQLSLLPLLLDSHESFSLLSATELYSLSHYWTSPMYPILAIRESTVQLGRRGRQDLCPVQ